jgi:predicted enzyme related to lactoylglutathione lyase
MPTIHHFEIPADDAERAQKFFKDVFGWSMQKWINPEKPDHDYWFFETQDDNGNKGLSGGMMKRQAPEHKMTNYITVLSIDDYVSKIQQAGGKIMIPKTKIPNMGYFAVFTDTENNQFGLFEAKQQ